MFGIIDVNCFNKGLFLNIVNYYNKVNHDDIANILLDNEVKYKPRRTYCFRKLD